MERHFLISLVFSLILLSKFFLGLKILVSEPDNKKGLLLENEFYEIFD